MDVGWGDGADNGSGNEFTSRVRGWGGGVIVVVVNVVWCIWVMSEAGFGSDLITGGGVWSSGEWVSVVMRDGGDLDGIAWGSGWSILWSVGSSAGWDSAVDTERTVGSVAWWEGSLGRDGGDKGDKGEFHC